MINAKNVLNQVSTGAIVGLSSIVYAISHGALLFSGNVSSFVSIGMSSALITALICTLGSWFFKEKTFIMGTDSSTVSVMVGSLLVLDVLNTSREVSQATILVIILALSLVSALIFFLVARLNLSNYVRFVPFSVMAGLLASTGWLMCSGALTIISGIALSKSGLALFLDDPFRPELLVGFFVALSLLLLSKKYSTAILIPCTIICTSIGVHFLLRSFICNEIGSFCKDSTWLFSFDSKVSWIPFWKINFFDIDVKALIHSLPSMLVVAFVGVITILLAVASLELSYRKEFDLNQALKVHAGTALVSALSGGFLGVISTGRTALNKSSGGGVLSNCIGASLCLLMLLGGGSLLVLIPRAAMGGVILFLGLSMLKTWVWNQYANLTKGEFIEIALILLVVANFGYLVGFSLGVAFACISFVIACSKTPLTSLNSDLSMMTSSVVRHEMQRKILGEQGRRSLIFKLSGYVFFGSANNIEKIFQEAEQQKIQNILLDFSDTVGIDRSAIGVFNRILRRESLSSLRFYFVYGVSNREAVLSMGDQAMNSVSDKVLFFPDLDLAIEAMEESVLDQTVTNRKEIDCFDFIDNLSERELLVSHCELISYQRDAVLCQEGERSDQIFFLKKGELEIVKEISGSSVRLSKMSDGAMVGEMAFYSKEVRTATIRATSASEVYVLNGNSLSELRNRNSELATQFDVFVIKKLSNALSRTNKLVASFY